MHARPMTRNGWTLAGLGAACAAAAAAADPPAARGAAAQDWQAFVLVGGLLLVGLVAEEDRLFAAAGESLAATRGGRRALFAWTIALVAVVTAVLNLDTSVAFVTPVLVYAARRRGADEEPVLLVALLVSNAASLLLPGANLTNLIVLGHLHLSGARFAARMGPAWIVAILVTAGVLAVATRDERGAASAPAASPPRSLGDRERRSVVGLPAVAAAAVLTLALPSPAVPVAGVGVVAACVRAAGVRRQGRAPLEELRRLAASLGLPVLAGLFGVAVGVGSLGRAWAGPAHLLGHLGSWGTAGMGALASVVLNNLPAATLLAAHRPAHPFSLLVGLDIGPNLFVTGSLAWFLWVRAARSAGSRPPVARATRVGLIAAPAAMAGALAMLALMGLR